MMVELSIGQVAGIIAAATLISELLLHKLSPLSVSPV